MDRAVYEEYRALQDSGVDVSSENIGVRYNAGGESETFKHSTLKNLVSHVSLLNGYKCDSEVPVRKCGEIIGEVDVVIWAHPERLSYAVEVETSPEEGILSEKREKYVDGTAINDIQLINATDAPVDMIEASEHIADELGLKL